MAGVFLVFTFLVVPSLAAVMFFSSLVVRYVFGLALSLAGCLMGLFVSVKYDLPTGPSIVVVYAGFLAVLGLVRMLFPRNSGTEEEK